MNKRIKIFFALILTYVLSENYQNLGQSLPPFYCMQNINFPHCVFKMPLCNFFHLKSFREGKIITSFFASLSKDNAFTMIYTPDIRWQLRAPQRRKSTTSKSLSRPIYRKWLAANHSSLFNHQLFQRDIILSLC